MIAVVVSCIGRTPHVIEESLRVDETTVTEETTTATESTTITTTIETTTTTSTSQSSTTTEMTTSETTTTTTTTRRLMTYDILARIDMITMLLDQSDYKRLVEKNPEDLTAEERTELQYYACLVFERKQLREYLDTHKDE
jgi:hypothetical protein